jgi:predicted aldo/keto reductase-like oxidoreductase
MEYRNFGKTGAQVSILTLGGCGVGYVEQEEADKAIQLAMDNGINMIDVAPTYGQAESRLSKWIQNYRNQFFLAEKTLKRTKKSAERQLKRSLERLGTDNFDLYQFHSVSTLDELNQILGKGGAMEAFREAKESGIIKNIGITGHEDMQVLKRALEVSDVFDTVLLPVYLGSAADFHPVNDFRPVLTIAREKNIGVTAIKAISKGRWKADPFYNTWYEPMTEQALIDQAVLFTLSQDGVCTYSLPCDVKLWSKVIDAGNKFVKLNDLELEKIKSSLSEEKLSPLFPKV